MARYCNHGHNWNDGPCGQCYSEQADALMESIFHDINRPVVEVQAELRAIDRATLMLVEQWGAEPPQAGLEAIRLLNQHCEHLRSALQWHERANAAAPPNRED